METGGRRPDGPNGWDPMSQFPMDGPAARNPYPKLAELRRTTPVGRRQAWSDAGEAVEAVEVYRYDDVAAVMRDNDSFSSSSVRAGMEPVMGKYVLVGMDEPEHRRLRDLVATGFRPKSIAHWETDIVLPVVDEMIDAFAARGEAELVQELTFRYPVQVIAAILGLPLEDHAKFHAWASSIINLVAAPVEGMTAAAELRDYLAVVLDDRRAHPSGDFVSELAAVELDGERLGDEEIFSFLRLLLPAGAETTYRATGNLLFGLLSNPAQLDAVCADRSLVVQAVEESIRWETPLMITSRVATCDVEFAGTPVAAGTQVIPNVGAANHDETRWDHAEDYDLFREQKPMISFGVGPHMCLGMHLARMEMRTALSRLLHRCPGLRFDDDAVARDDVHIHGETFRSPTTLPVLFDAAA